VSLAAEAVTKTLTLSQSLSKEDCVLEIVGVLVTMDLDSAWPMGHLLRSLSRPEVLFECRQLLEEHLLDLVQSFTTRRSRRMVAAWKVVCPKGKRGDQGLRDYSCHHSAATAAIPKLFGAAKHFCAKNADGELSYKYKAIQSEYVGNLDKLKLFRKRMEAFDMFDPFLIPTWTDPDAISVLDRWGDRKVDVIDLTKHWSKVLLEHVCAWQRDTFDWCNDEDDLTSMEGLTA